MIVKLLRRIALLEEHGLMQDEVTEGEASKCEVMRRSAVEASVISLELSFSVSIKLKFLRLYLEKPTREFHNGLFVYSI